MITLEELNKCVAALPDPHIAREMGRTLWRVAIEPDMPARPVYDDPSPIGPTIRIATFALKHGRKGDQDEWRWTPTDEIIV